MNKSLAERLAGFNPDCNYDCYNCEYGMMYTEGDSHSCPLDAVQRMINDFENGHPLWPKR